MIPLQATSLGEAAPEGDETKLSGTFSETLQYELSLRMSVVFVISHCAYAQNSSICLCPQQACLTYQHRSVVKSRVDFSREAGKRLASLNDLVR